MFLVLVAGLLLVRPSSNLANKCGAHRASQAQQLSRWEAEADARYRTLTKKYGTGKNKVLREKLIQMGIEDQSVRKWMMTLPQSQWTSAMGEEQRQTDLRLTAELKEIVRKYGWPTIPLVGVKASDSAMLILVHSPDHKWQKSMIPTLTALVNKGEIAGPDLATLIDKELVAAGHNQLFGTQFAFKNGKMMMYQVKAPAGLDARRAKWLLPPEAAYKFEMSQIYSGLCMTDQVSPPPAPVNNTGN
jgi:hypothetical protein